jgi:diadenosine tetraphosphate (Ap4A) HIT family hydrolase
MFNLDPRLAADTRHLLDLELCTVRLMNDARYPWLVLVPQQPGLSEILDLPKPQRSQLYSEIDHCAAALQTAFQPDKLNIAALGNVVAQLHVHVIARFKTDDAWPAPVWGKHPAKVDEAVLGEWAEKLRQVLA